MAISLAKKKAAPAPANKGGGGGGGGSGKSGAPLGLMAAFLAAGAFAAEMYAPPGCKMMAFQVTGGLAGLMGALGTLGAIKGLRNGPKGAAALGLLLSVGALGAVAYGFTRPPVPAPAPEPAPAPARPSPETSVTISDTDAPPATNAVSATPSPVVAVTNAAPAVNLTPVKVERLLPVTTRTNLLRARTGKLPKPESKPEPKPAAAKVVWTEPEPKSPEPAPTPAPPAPAMDSQFPELSALAPAIDLPPPNEAPAAQRHPNTFRGATLATFEEINIAASNFKAVNNLDVAQLLDISGMRNTEIIVERYRRIAIWLQRQAQFRATIDRADTVYEQRLRQANTPEDRLMTTLVRFRETREQLFAKTLAQTIAAGRVHSAAAAVLKVLGDNFDSWTFNADEQKLLFDNQRIAAKYRAASEKVKLASAQLPGS